MTDQLLGYEKSSATPSDEPDDCNVSFYSALDIGYQPNVQFKHLKHKSQLKTKNVRQ
jgi:hypothetical protein